MGLLLPLTGAAATAAAAYTPPTAGCYICCCCYCCCCWCSGAGLGTGSGQGEGSGLSGSGSDYWWRKGAVQYASNEVYVDLIEKISGIVDRWVRQGETVSSSLPPSCCLSCCCGSLVPLPWLLLVLYLHISLAAAAAAAAAAVPPRCCNPRCICCCFCSLTSVCLHNSNGQMLNSSITGKVMMNSRVGLSFSASHVVFLFAAFAAVRTLHGAALALLLSVSFCLLLGLLETPMTFFSCSSGDFLLLLFFASACQWWLQLSGIPELCLTIRQPEALQQAAFHPCVRRVSSSLFLSLLSPPFWCRLMSLYVSLPKAFNKEVEHPVYPSLYILLLTSWVVVFFL